MIRKTVTVLLLLLAHAYVLTAGEIRGRLSDAEAKNPLIGATVSLIGTRLGAVSDAEGNYVVASVPAGTYNVRIAYVGYVTVQRRVTVAAEPVVLDVALTPTTIDQSEVIIERNRAVARETPVAFSDVGKMEIEQKLHGQDAPLLVQGTPGVYTYSTDGVGNGEAKVLVRGFTQEYVQVLVNGIPTNDPESNAVYWSNWGAVSSNASSIQIQRGAGSSLYGAGSFGGSFNIVTGEASPKPAYLAHFTLGSPMNTMYGIDLNTGLINNTFAASVRVDRKIGEGTRISGRYEGINYYMSLGWYINPQQSLKFVLHGAPQRHGYSYSSDISFFKKYGYTANGAPFLPHSVVDALPANPNTGLPNYGLLDDSRELVDPDYVNLSHNFYHKPQAELHYRYDINPTTSVQATAFYSKGRGAGSSLTGSGTTFSRSSSTGAITSVLGPDGTIIDPAVAQNTYLRNAMQRISYSFHQQGGILASVTTRPIEILDLTVGGEFRSWTADHPGHYTNLFGNRFGTTSYARQDTLGNIMTSTFRRRVYQGDLKGPESDIGNIFGWELASDDPTYRSQYRNYRGETPQYTIFGQGNWKFNRFNVMTSVQYVWYKYSLIENMPSENAIGRMLTRAQEAQRGSGLVEGPTGAGTFLMKDSATVNARWYEFPLVNQERSRGFWQPKFGVNYNVDDNLNVFASMSHVERFVNLSIYYNQGRPDPTVEDEKSNQFEGGIGWTSEDVRAKVNGYYMTWENKSASVLDFSKAGQPGYDRNGYHYDLIGTSEHKGIEAEIVVSLDNILPVKGFEVTGSLTMMDNKWKEVLDKVKKDPTTGARRAFNTGALDAKGKVDTLFFDELVGKAVSSGPQDMIALGVNYRKENFFCGINMNYISRNVPLDGGTYFAVDGTFRTVGTTEYFDAKYDYRLPAFTIFNFNAGYSFNLAGFRASASVQVNNLFDKEYLSNADRNGVYPGIGRTWRLNLTAGI